MIEDMFEKLTTPPAANLLGWHFVGWNADNGTLTIGFEGKAAFANPVGNVQGGLLTAMLDDTMGPAILAHSADKRYGHTIDLQVQLLRPVPPGPIRAHGRVTRLGRTIAYLEGELFAPDGSLAVRATASALVVDIKDVSASLSVQ
jgi:uncharacterized protein (TIGR00369 family)